MRIGPAAALLSVLVLASVNCGTTVLPGGALFRHYEYEEEMYLSLDGRATIYVNSSIPALNALRGTAFDARPNARVDTNAVRAYFNTPITHVVRVTSSRRSNRRFVHVRVAVDDIRRLSAAPAFSWSSYDLKPSGELIAYKQSVGSPARAASDSHWTGDELVAFRIHIPSVITDHNAGADNFRRGNILVWEQPLTERLKGAPLTLEARMEPRSILYRTLFLFAATIAAVGGMFAIIIWRVVRKGARLKAR